MIRRVVAMVAVALFNVMPAGATGISFTALSVNDQGQFSTVPGATTVDFNALAPGTQDLVAGIATYDNVNIFSCACSTTGDLPDDTTNGASALGGGSYAIDFSSPISYFGLYWGSPDEDNVLTFYNGSTLIFAFSGNDLHTFFGIPYGTTSATYVNFFGGFGASNLPATRIVVSGGQFPFESDNHAFLAAPAAVPEPTSLLLFSTGGLGLLARYRRRRAR